jgi:hypothetical protein
MGGSLDPKESFKMTGFYIAEKDLAALDELAFAGERTRSGQVRLIIKEYIIRMRKVGALSEAVS